MAGRTWEDWEVDALRKAYACGGGPEAAQRALPHRSPAAIAVRASWLGISVRPTLHPAAIANTETPAVAIVGRIKPLFRDQRETVRARIIYTARQLASELKLHPVRVIREIRDLALENFAKDPSLIRMDDEEAEAAAYGVSTMETPSSTAIAL